MIKKCLQQFAKHERDYILSPLDRFLLTLKAVISIALHLEANEKVDTYDSRYVTVAIIASGKHACEFGTCYWWESVKVSLYWHEWRYIVDYDSSP